MRSVFILNPNAGKRKSAAALAQKIETFFKSRGEAAEVVWTQRPGDGRRLARALSETGEPLRLFACGGDGSVFDVLNGMAGREHCTLGVLPCGTGNDFLRSFTGREHFESLEDQLAGREVRLDVLQAGEHYCLNQASLGLDAQVCAHKDAFRRLPLVGGQAAYVLALLVCFFTAIRHRFTISVDGGPPQPGEYLLAVAANGRFYGGGFESAPHARPNDGLLDSLSITAVSRLRVLSLLRRYARGEHLSYPICHYRQGHTLRVTAEKEMALNLDGEVFRAQDVTLCLRPGFLRFWLPRGSDFHIPPQPQA